MPTEGMPHLLQCNCPGWVKSQPQIDSAQTLAFIHGIPYTGDRYLFCPWCARDLSHGELLPIPRSVVMAFARAMEARLRQNDYKGGWEKMENSWLFGRLLYKVGMLARCILNSESDTMSTLQHGADMANYAMMILDNEELLG